MLCWSDSQIPPISLYNDHLQFDGNIIQHTNPTFQQHLLRVNSSNVSHAFTSSGTRCAFIFFIDYL